MAIVAFTDSKGVRHKDVELPASLVKPGVSHRQREAYLVKSGQISLDPLPAMKEPKEVAAVVIDDARTTALERRLSALEGRPVAELPTDAALAEWSRQAQRVSLSHQEMNAVAEQTVATCEAAAKGAEERLAGLDAQQQALIGTVSEAVSDAKTDVAAAVQALQQDAAAVKAEAIDSSVATSVEKAVPAAEKAARQVANQHWGSSVTIAPEDPSEVDGSSFAKRWYGRDALIPGDGVFQTTKDGIIAHRYTGNGWVKSAELNPRTEIVSQPLSILDQSTKVNSPITINKGGGGGGAGGEQLMVNRMTPGGASYVLADSSNWAGVHDPLSGTLELEIRALDGAFSGRSGVVVAAFTWDGATADKWAEYALIGDLQGVYEVNLSIQRGNASLPPGAAGLSAVTIPLGSQALRVYATVQVVAGAGTPGATQFSVRGSVDWNFESEPRLLDPTQSGPQPLWIYT